MKTAIISIDPNNIDKTKLKSAAKALDGGELVGFPTETVYGIGVRAKAESIDNLNMLKSRTADKFYSLHVSKKTDIGLYVPQIPLPAQKLIQTALPGPLTLVFQLTDEQMDYQRRKLGQEISDCLYKDNSIGIRCPNNEVARILLGMVKYPVLATSGNKTGAEPPTEAKEVLEYFDGQLDVMVDAGPCRYKKPSTVVKIEKNKVQTLRPGVYTIDVINEMSRVNFLFVCTGNTCRSPMAEGIFKKYLAEKIDSKIDFLEDLGYKVISAGVMGLDSMPVSAGATVACKAKGVDISSYESRALTPELVNKADYIFTMSKEHRRVVIAMVPEAAEKCCLLGGSKGVADPIGQQQEVYDKCANEIEQAVREIICRLSI